MNIKTKSLTFVKLLGQGSQMSKTLLYLEVHYLFDEEGSFLPGSHLYELWKLAPPSLRLLSNHSC